MITPINPADGSSFPQKNVAYTGTAGSTGTWPPGPESVIVWSTTDAIVAVGEGVTASSTVGTPIPAFTALMFRVPPGTGAPWRVSAIQLSAGGTLYAKPANKE